MTKIDIDDINADMFKLTCWYRMEGGEWKKLDITLLEIIELVEKKGEL